MDKELGRTGEVILWQREKWLLQAALKKTRKTELSRVANDDYCKRERGCCSRGRIIRIRRHLRIKRITLKQH